MRLLGFLAVWGWCLNPHSQPPNYAPSPSAGAWRLQRAGYRHRAHFCPDTHPAEVTQELV